MTLDLLKATLIGKTISSLAVVSSTRGDLGEVVDSIKSISASIVDAWKKVSKVASKQVPKVPEYEEIK